MYVIELILWTKDLVFALGETAKNSKILEFMKCKSDKRQASCTFVIQLNL